MMGRYSLDQPGLILSDSRDSQAEQLTAYETKVSRPLSEVQFKPDADGIIPVLDGEWLTGTFDRVVFGPGASARILDFKTDKFDGDSLLTDQLKEKAAVYTDQLAIYRKVLARMTLQPSTGEFASSVHRRVRASLLL